MTPEIMQALRDFRDERDWQKFHSPPELARAIQVEGAELGRHFLWGQYGVAHREAILGEAADVIIFALYLLDRLDADPVATVLAKIEANRKKYPASDSQSLWPDPPA